MVLKSVKMGYLFLVLQWRQGNVKYKIRMISKLKRRKRRNERRLKLVEEILQVVYIEVDTLKYIIYHVCIYHISIYI